MKKVFSDYRAKFCRRQFKTTPLFHQNIGVGKAKQRRCFNVRYRYGCRQSAITRLCCSILMRYYEITRLCCQ